jgi:ABC-type nitrate/sulfonate/bicarbonate transport system substrate-binding protein
MKKILTLCVILLMAACANVANSPPPPNDPVTLRVNVFRGASNLPIYMAQEKGYFSRRGLTLQMQFTPNSSEQRAGLAAGRFEIAHAAVDNSSHD